MSVSSVPVNLSVPIESDPLDIYVPPTITITLWGTTLPAFATRLLPGLVSANATLADGKVVESAEDALLWCIQQIDAGT